MENRPSKPAGAWFVRPPGRIRAADAARFIRSWRSLRRQFDRALSRCRRNPTTGQLHKLRTTSRRLLAHLAIMEEAGTSSPGKFRRRLKRLLSITSPLRDAQVQMELFNKLAPRERHAKLRHRLRRKLHKERAAMRGKLAKRARAVRRHRRDAPAPVLSGFKGVFPGAASRALRKAHRRMRRRLCEAKDARTRHRARMALKRYRYLLEAARPADVAGLEKLRRLQVTMGDQRDLELFDEQMKRFGAHRAVARSGSTRPSSREAVS